MSYEVFWFLPTSGDTRYLGKSDFSRAPSNAYLRQVAETVDRLGYDGILIPTGASCADPWVTAATLVGVTRRIKLLVALRTSISGPTAARGRPPRSMRRSEAGCCSMSCRAATRPSSRRKACFSRTTSATM